MNAMFRHRSPCPAIFTEHFRRWARLMGNHVCDTLGGVPDDVYPRHYLGASGKGILQHVALADDDG